MVLQADGDPKTGDSDITRGSPKKAKPNKIPQRGLGIAALEKLRREEQQRRIAGSFSGDESVSSVASTTSYGDHSVPGTIFDSLPKQGRPATSYLTALEPTSMPCFFGSFPPFLPSSNSGVVSPPLAWNPIQNETSLDPNSRLPLLLRKPPEHHHHQHHQKLEPQRCSLVVKNFLSSPSSSGACLQMEPPSNQSYLSINPSPMPDENKSANLKRSWPFQTGTTRPFMITPGYHGSSPTFRNDEKRISLPRDDASCSSSSGAPKLDGSLLSLSLLPPSNPNSVPTISSQKHYIQVHKNAEEKISEAAGPPTLYNFMGLPHDLIESNPSYADPEFKGESEYRSLK